MAVYEKYYGCQREPFSLNPDPEFLFAAAPHREALAQLRYLVQERKGFALITGEVGTGKTLLLRTMFETAGPKVRTVYVFNPPRTRQGLYDAIADELGLHLDLNDSTNPAMKLNRYFLSTYEDGETVVMIFDEAQALPIEVLEEIRLLTNIETPRAKLVQVILAGQSELDVLIDSAQLRALRQRLVFRFSLAPLGRADAVSYIAARMAAAGAERSPFTLAACDAVHRYSGGIPRLINVICDNAMLSAYATESPTIDEKQIEEIASDLKLTVSPRGRTDLRRVPLKAATAQAPSRIARSRAAQGPSVATNAAAEVRALTPRPPVGSQERLAAIDAVPKAAPAPMPPQPMDSPEPLAALEDGATIEEGRPRELEACEQPRPTPHPATSRRRSPFLRLTVAFFLASLLLAFAIATLAALYQPLGGPASGLMRLRDLLEKESLRFDGRHLSFAQGTDLSAIRDRTR